MCEVFWRGEHKLIRADVQQAAFIEKLLRPLTQAGKSSHDAPILCTLALAVVNDFACTPNHVFKVILESLNEMEGLRSRMNGLVWTNSWSDGRKRYDNAFLCFQSWYTNTFSQKNDSFSKHYRLLWEEPCASSTSVKLERQRE